MPIVKTERDASGILRVGEGRGFVVQAMERRLVITAAHCLPKLPACCSFDDHIYRKLIGPLGAKPEISVLCYFADPVADIAVLRAVDDQRLPEQADAYERLIGTVKPLRVADALIGPAWLYSLDRNWFSCQAWRMPSGPLWLKEAAEPIRGGMSGSPVCDEQGRAIGVLVAGDGCSDLGDDDREGGPNPALTCDLPGRLLAELTGKRRIGVVRRARLAALETL